MRVMSKHYIENMSYRSKCRCQIDISVINLCFQAAFSIAYNKFLPHTVIRIPIGSQLLDILETCWCLKMSFVIKIVLNVLNVDVS